MSARSKLFFHQKIYGTDTDALFAAAMCENVEWHLLRCNEYAALMESRGFQIEDLRKGDIFSLPPIPTLFLKKHELLSMPEKKLRLKSTTSGTSGSPVRVGLDAQSMLYGFNILRKTLFYHRLLSIVPTNDIVLGYEPSKHNQMGAVKTAYGATLLAPALHREYALKDTGEGYALNEQGVIDALLRYSRAGFPVRINGFPAYLFFLLRRLEQENIRLRLHPKSLIFLGGGWKQFSAQRVEKEKLYSMAHERLAITEDRFMEFFGVVEHNVPYCACKNHHFHVPVYSRVTVRSFETMKPLPYGERGLLNLMTPLLKSMPLMSILTDDIAVLHEGKECGCGIQTPYFEVLGRAGVQGLKTCAAGAGAMLEGRI